MVRVQRGFLTECNRDLCMRPAYPGLLDAERSVLHRWWSPMGYGRFLDRRGNSVTDELAAAVGVQASPGTQLHSSTGTARTRAALSGESGDADGRQPNPAGHIDYSVGHCQPVAYHNRSPTRV
uniref:Uncharacterized protein n=1 Tax=Plectus sambesii TaxID=2011161 RepID=A0A914VTH1_9BILA